MTQQHRMDMRTAIARQLGDSVESVSTLREVHATLIAASDQQFSATFSCLRLLSSGDIICGHSGCDEVSALLDLLGMSVDPVPGTVTTLGGSRLAVFGCSNNSQSIRRDEWDRFFAAGGVLVSSDRSLRYLDIPSRGLVAGEPQGPRRGRLCLAGAVSSRLPTIGTGYVWDAAAISLEAGHVPCLIESDRDHAPIILAYDAPSNQPLVVMERIGAGWWIHSVVHWYQHAPVPATAVERCLIHPRRHQLSGTDLPADTTLGLLLAARTMVTTLCVALEMATGQQRR